MIRCSECPRCKDTYPGKLDDNGNHFYICGMSGNKVYKEPRRERRANGRGWIKFSDSSCGIYDTFEDALKAMTEPERRRYYENREPEQLSMFD